MICLTPTKGRNIRAGFGRIGELITRNVSISVGALAVIAHRIGTALGLRRLQRWMAFPMAQQSRPSKRINPSSRIIAAKCNGDVAQPRMEQR